MKTTRSRVSVLFVVAVVLLLFGAVCWADDGVYNITDFGAKGDGKTMNTAAIQSAIDACNKAGGGRVLIPAGKFFSGTIIMKDNVELHVSHGAILQGVGRKVQKFIAPAIFTCQGCKKLSSFLGAALHK
jgi:polygalacturonase